MRTNPQLSRQYPKYRYRPTAGSTNSLGKSKKPLYFHGIITDDRDYLPPSAKDMYEVKAEISSLRAMINQALTAKPGVDDPSQKRRATHSRRVLGHTLPTALSSISDAIENSKDIVNRAQDPSDELGAICAEETWRRAMSLLAAHAKKVWRYAHVKVSPPIISPGPRGSVDIYWPPDPYGLLINIPADSREPVTYYGDDAESPDSNHTSGKISHPEKVDPGVLAWLAHMGEK